jgi:hypothetical protein
MEEQCMAKLWTRRIERRVSGGCKLGERTEENGGKERKRKRRGWLALGIKWAQRCFSRLANAARPLFTMAAWLNGEALRRTPPTAV